LEFNRRGHDSKSVKEATRLLRRFGFEICYQVMVGLPGSNSRLDVKLLCELLWEDDYSPDALKIYPCLLLKEDIANQSRIRQLYRKGIWKPLNSGEYINLLNKCLPKIPRYVHINRIQRIIEKEKIEAGPADVIDREQFSHVSNCLWQRSVAQKKLDLHIDFRANRIINYYQGNKRYCFEAIFETNIILGYARMDVVSPHSAIIRDIRVLGDMVPIGSKKIDTKGCQNIGIGTSIMKAMEIKAVEEYLQYIFVKPSFGTISWFEKLGYKSICYYFMYKQLTENENSRDEIIQEIKAILTQ
jgi:elongator complex protein 3